MKIDFVSDIACPWCAIGLASLETALARLGNEVPVELHFQPFELNPEMPPEGKDVVEYLGQKYGISPEQVHRNHEAIRQRGADVGFRFDMDKRTRTYNTFDAHRLLHWAGLEGRQLPLKRALFAANFTQGENPADPEVLARLAAQAGLDPERARQVLASGEYADEVRERERFYTERGIHSVPSVIIDDKHLIQGGQPPEAFERALRQIAQE
ncbi:MAG TPA: DsbA family oxidoreductase [Albitalea sp.]|uniref:DsbA family oxidoreductase n=1 Tax=Piscinibacter sp. TaxID=1903157 RepID=UPI002ED1FC66